MRNTQRAVRLQAAGNRVVQELGPVQIDFGFANRARQTIEALSLDMATEAAVGGMPVHCPRRGIGAAFFDGGLHQRK